MVIQSLDLREIEMSGRHYTWVSSGDDPTYKKLDRVLVSTEWENKFPLNTILAKDRSNSDHTPLLLNTGASSHNRHQPLFKLERGWLLRDGFYDLVADVWHLETKGISAIEKWQNKIRSLRQFLRWWAKNIAGHNKKEKKQLVSMIDELDKKAENTILSDQEINLKRYLNEQLVHLLREEQLKWYERAKKKDLLGGDNNTQYFHLVANGKHRKQ